MRVVFRPREKVHVVELFPVAIIEFAAVSIAIHAIALDVFDMSAESGAANTPSHPRDMRLDDDAAHPEFREAETVHRGHASGGASAPDALAGKAPLSFRFGEPLGGAFYASAIALCSGTAAVARTAEPGPELVAHLKPCGK
ncbi:MAG: hypothetical protein DHS20C04_01550 [Hyphococcus sp.]|nr:MAG: hypothetical protein DHS20C04_01550 [Marinicaulis sp.]